MRRAFVAALGLALPAAACAGVLGFEELHVGEDASVDAAIDATPDASPDVADASDAGPTCMHARWPERPDAAGGGSIAFVAALRAFDFGLAVDGGAGAVPGFDLDDFCTVTPGMNSCASSATGTTFATYVADKDGLNGGTDNAGYGLLKFLGAATDTVKQEAINAQLAAGVAGLLARVKNYNGMPDDPDVFVEWFPALGVAGSTADGAPPRPAFDEGDTWIRDATYWNVATYDTSTIFDSNAYVAGGKVVAHFDALSLTLPFFSGNLFVVIRDAVVVADIVKTPSGSYRLTNGLFAGRWATRDILAALGPIYDSAFNAWICQSPTLYASVKSTACPARDIAARAQNDGADAGCGAISVGVKFETAPATDRKRFASPPDAGDPCADSGIPANDDCTP